MTLDRTPPKPERGLRYNLPFNFATFDHLRDRLHPQRQERANGGERRIVLACWHCNWLRSVRRLAVNIDEQRCRSGHANLVGRS